MDFVILGVFILLIVIIMKISSLSTRLKVMEKLLEKALFEKSEKQINTVRKALESKKNIKKETIKKESIQNPKKLSLLEIDEVKEELKQNQSQSVTLFDKYKEKFQENSFEELLFGNILLKIGIIAFILGVGFFLKYSIDKDWIPIWGRVFIGILLGISMLITGIKMVQNRHKLFSETLFGGGIAILYLSVFAAFALEGFNFISVYPAFIAMIIITILAGIISVQFNAKSTAIFGLIGGFATPFLLNTGLDNYVGLLTYMLMLNFGILFISIYKKWSLLSWMAFIITSLTVLLSVWETNNNFLILVFLYTAFFLIYSIVPFVNEIREKEQSLNVSFVFLFWMNFIVTMASYSGLFIHYKIDSLYYAVITILLAAYLLLYAFTLTKKNVLLKNLFYIVLAQALALLLITPVFIFEGNYLTLFWAIESLMLIWIATKSKEGTYGIFAFFGFAITVFRYLVFDVFYYLETLVFTSFFVIGAFFMAYKLLENSNLDFKYVQNQVIKSIILVTGVGLLFLFLNVELYHLIKLSHPLAIKFALTLLWITFGIVLFVYGIIKDIEVVKLVGTGLIILAILKAFFVDLANLNSLYRIVLFLILGIILFGLSYFYENKTTKERNK
ncbi:MAG: Unknown protein [uncultured Sulfurovum sp.]|uniref:DUF2339 domain-containing protein n=1 Tax=uncultured Sulfurovum sp. TaxID=269237 RepID=A0A6S6TY52_9BACT|nr:MAG: Unknown protein [uncultured Sulfurovum sp.]